MRDEGQTRKQLLNELTEMHRRIARLEEEQREHELVKAALLASENRFRTIIDNLPVRLFVKDVNSTYIACNLSYAQDLGIRTGDVSGKTDYDFYPKDLAEQYRSDDRTVVESGQGLEIDEGYVRHGQHYFVKTTKTPLKDELGRVSGILGVFRDITDSRRAEEELERYRHHLEDLVEKRTAALASVNERLTLEIDERKKVEQTLQEWQQMLQAVLDTIPVRVFWKNLGSEYLGCSRSFALDAGFQSPEEIIGKNDFEMGWAEQAELYRADDRLVMETGRPKLGYEEPQTTPTGDRIWLLTNKVPLLDAQGRMKGVLGTYEDITKSKRMEEVLRASETKYRIVSDNTYDWEYWVSAEGQFLYTSPSCRRITGYPASDFEADPELLSRIIHPDDLTQFEAHQKQDQTTNAPCELEFRIIHRGGATRWIGHVCQPVFDARGWFLGRRGSNRDITDRKLAEVGLQESSHKLKLFAYSVAHDLKSPAIGVYGLSKRLCKNYKDVLDEKGRSYCEQILKTSEHIAALADKINVYIATKEALLSIEKVNITEILHMLRDEFSAQLSIRRIEWQEPDAAVEIKADRLSVVRAFRNFVDNSLKYGGERLSKIWTGYEESREFHIFSFSDNGKGLKEEDSEKIFGAFQRNETSRGVEGAGLGLTIVKEIAEQHGGKVWVEPRGKKGTTFYISFAKSLQAGVADV